MCCHGDLRAARPAAASPSRRESAAKPPSPSIQVPSGSWPAGPGPQAPSLPHSSVTVAAATRTRALRLSPVRPAGTGLAPATAAQPVRRGAGRRTHWQLAGATWDSLRCEVSHKRPPKPPVFVNAALKRKRKILAFTWSRVSPLLPQVYNRVIILPLTAKHQICALPIIQDVGPRF